MFSVRNRLSLMMFLEIFIWGAWLPLIFGYLGEGGLNFTPLQQGFILNAFAICSITTLLFSANLADRYFAAEKFLSISHLIAAVAMLGLFFALDLSSFLIPILDSCGIVLSSDPPLIMRNTQFVVIMVLMFIHSFFYVPTISVANSISFANIKNSRDFGLIRLWGTIGWIAASWPFIFILVDYSNVPTISEAGFVKWLGEVFDNGLKGQELVDSTRYAFMVSAIAGLLCSVVSMTLPHTPPKQAEAGSSMAWLDSLKLLKHPFMLVLFIVTMIDATVHQCFFLWTGTFLQQDVGIPSNWVVPVMSVGQIAEILTMIFLGTVLKNFGWKATMIVGILGHTIRFAVFALQPTPALAITVMMLHGICYAFFFATVYIFVDDVFPKNMRSTAQGLFNLAIVGIGPFVGNFLWTYISGVYTVEVTQVVDGVEKIQRITSFHTIFWVPSALAALAAFILLIGFYPPKSTTEQPIEDESTGEI